MTGRRPYASGTIRAQQHWTLIQQPTGVTVDSGGIADSVGRRVGFRYRIPKWAYTTGGSGIRKIGFTVATPREAAVTLISRINALCRVAQGVGASLVQSLCPRMASTSALHGMGVPAALSTCSAASRQDIVLDDAVVGEATRAAAGELPDSQKIDLWQWVVDAENL